MMVHHLIEFIAKEQGEVRFALLLPVSIPHLLDKVNEFIDLLDKYTHD